MSHEHSLGHQGRADRRLTDHWQTNADNEVCYAGPEPRASIWRPMTDYEIALRAELDRLRETNEALQAINKANGAVLPEQLLSDRGWTRADNGNWQAPA